MRQELWPRIVHHDIQVYSIVGCQLKCFSILMSLQCIPVLLVGYYHGKQQVLDAVDGFVCNGAIGKQTMWFWQTVRADIESRLLLTCKHMAQSLFSKQAKRIPISGVLLSPHLEVCSNACQDQYSGADALQIAPGHLQNHADPMRGCSQKLPPLLNSPDSHIPDPLSPLGSHGSMHGCVQIVMLAGTYTLVHSHPAFPPFHFTPWLHNQLCSCSCMNQDNWPSCASPACLKLIYTCYSALIQLLIKQLYQAQTPMTQRPPRCHTND